MTNERNDCMTFKLVQAVIGIAVAMLVPATGYFTTKTIKNETAIAEMKPMVEQSQRDRERLNNIREEPPDWFRTFRLDVIGRLDRFEQRQQITSQEIYELKRTVESNGKH